MSHEIPKIDIKSVIHKRMSPLFFSYDIISVENDKMQHSIHFGIEPISITIDGTTMPSIRFALRLWKFECSFGIGSI